MGGGPDGCPAEGLRRMGEDDLELSPEGQLREEREQSDEKQKEIQRLIREIGARDGYAERLRKAEDAAVQAVRERNEVQDALKSAQVAIESAEATIKAQRTNLKNCSDSRDALARTVMRQSERIRELLQGTEQLRNKFIDLQEELDDVRENGAQELRARIAELEQIRSDVTEPMTAVAELENFLRVRLGWDTFHTPAPRIALQLLSVTWDTFSGLGQMMNSWNAATSVALRGVKEASGVAGQRFLQAQSAASPEPTER